MSRRAACDIGVANGSMRTTLTPGAERVHGALLENRGRAGRVVLAGSGGMHRPNRRARGQKSSSKATVPGTAIW